MYDVVCIRCNLGYAKAWPGRHAPSLRREGVDKQAREAGAKVKMKKQQQQP